MLIKDIGVIFLCLRVHDFESYYHICGILQKDYMHIINDSDVIQMIAKSKGSDQVEVVNIIQ